MRVRMRVSMSGSRNGVLWPPIGATLDVGEDEAMELSRAGIATAVPADDTATHAAPVADAAGRPVPGEPLVIESTPQETPEMSAVKARAADRTNADVAGVAEARAAEARAEKAERDATAAREAAERAEASAPAETSASSPGASTRRSTRGSTARR